MSTPLAEPIDEPLTTHAGDGDEPLSTTLGLWNRLRDRSVVQRHLKLAETGDEATVFLDAAEAPVATGYRRMLFGDHGPYVEFEPRHLARASFAAGPAKSSPWYNEFYSAGSKAKLYEQLRTVASQPNPPKDGYYWVANNRPEGYADYVVGCWYCACDELVVRESAAQAAAAAEGREQAAGAEEAPLQLLRIPSVRRGRVRVYVAKRGFGHIIPEGDEEGGGSGEAGGEVFVHRSGIIGSEEDRFLCEGESVEFRLMETRAGKAMAVDVTGPGGGALRRAARRAAGELEEDPDALQGDDAMSPRVMGARCAKRLARLLRDGYRKRLQLEDRCDLPPWLRTVQRGSVVCLVRPCLEVVEGGCDEALRGVLDELVAAGWRVSQAAEAEAEAGEAETDGATVAMVQLEVAPGAAERPAAEEEAVAGGAAQTLEVLRADRQGAETGPTDTRVLISLRKRSGVRRLLLVAASVDVAVRDALTLCGVSTSTSGTAPFVPLHVTPVVSADGSGARRSLLVMLEREAGAAAGELGRDGGREYCWRCGGADHAKAQCI